MRQGEVAPIIREGREEVIAGRCSKRKKIERVDNDDTRTRRIYQVYWLAGIRLNQEAMNLTSTLRTVFRKLIFAFSQYITRVLGLERKRYCNNHTRNIKCYFYSNLGADISETGSIFFGGATFYATICNNNELPVFLLLINIKII